MRVVFLGATRGMGRALSRLLAERGDDLLLLGRNPERLQDAAKDLAIRGGKDEGFPVLALDLSEPNDFLTVVDQASEVLGSIDLVVVTAGVFATQETLESDTTRARELLTTNFVNTVAFCETVRPYLVANRGTLCVFSSVAGDQARKPVGIYGASKAGLSHYLKALDLRYYDRGLTVVCVKPGFVFTEMTQDLPTPPFAGQPEQVARDVLRAIDRGRSVVYTPAIWRWVMLVIRNLPQFVLRRVGF